MRADWRLAVPVAAGWASVAILVGLPGKLWPAALGLWVGAAVLLVVTRARQSGVLAVIALSLTLAAVLLTIAAIRAPARQPSELVRAADAGRRVSVLVLLSEDLVPGRPADGTMGDVPVTIFPPIGSELRARLGSTVSVAGTLVANDPADQTAFRIFATGHPFVRDPPAWYLGWATLCVAASDAPPTTCPATEARCCPASPSVTQAR